MALRLFAYVSVAALSSCSGGSYGTDQPPESPTSVSSQPVRYERLAIRGEDIGANIFDPSLEYEEGSTTGWLAYTDVEGDAFPIGPLHHTNIARTEDAGETWTLITRANESQTGSLTDNKGKKHIGAWAYEVPALVHVPDDPQAPWKLYTHRYFWTKDERLAAFGWISFREALHPSGPWSAETALFGTKFTPFAPFQTEISVADLDRSLSDIVALSEPGVLYRDGVIYLSLTGLKPDGPDRIFLLASDDFGKNWRFVSNLITRKDARLLGARRYDGSSLVEVGGDVFLLASPERNGLLHDGTTVFRFSEIETGALERQRSTPIIFNHIFAQSDTMRGDNRGGGQSDYDEGNTFGGVLFPQIDSDNLPGPIAEIYQTKEGLSE